MITLSVSRVGRESTLFVHLQTLFLAMFLSSIPAPAIAQVVTTGSISGQVIDESSSPLAGATVIATSNQGKKTTRSDSKGRFLIPYLTPGTYDVLVSLEGHQSVQQSAVMVALDQRIELHFTLATGTFEESIEVVGTAPVIDYASVSTGLGVDAAMLNQIPVGRQLSDSLYLAPGVSGSGGAGEANPSISGASGLENSYVVDGVNVADPRFGGLGVYSSSYGSIGTGVTYEFIETVQVRTGGAEAEYAQATGGAVNVITRSGSNEFHGSGFAYVSPAALEADRQVIDLAAGNANITQEASSDLGASLGGPILRDKAFFFAAINFQNQKTTMIAPDGYPLAELGEVEREREYMSYAGKITYNASGSHRLDLSVFGDPGKASEGPQSGDALLYPNTAAFSSMDFGGNYQSLLYHGILADSWLLEASIARAAHTYSEEPSVDEWQLIDYTGQPPQYSGGKGRYDGDHNGKNLQFRLKSSNIVGRHDIRYGLSFEDVTWESVFASTGPRHTLRDGRQTGSGVRISALPDPNFGTVYRISRSGLTRVRSSDQRYQAVFVQDKFFVNDRLTISAGIRYERQELIGTGNSVTFDDNWAPRLALTWDPSGSGRMKVFGSYGLYYSRIPNDLALLTFGDDGGRVIWADYFDPELTEPIPDGVEALGTRAHLIVSSGAPATVEPGAKTTYIQEGVVGFEYEALPQLTLGIQFIYRDMPRVIEDVSNAAAVLYFTGDADDVVSYIGNPREGSPETLLDVGAFEDPIHEYRSLEFTAHKRFSGRWSLVGSYRYSKLEGTYEGFYRNDNGQPNPAISSMFDYPTNDPSYTEVGVPVYGFGGDIRYLGALGAGPLPNDRPHQLKLWGSYNVAEALNLGAGLWATSGRPLTPFAADPVLGRAGDIPEAPRGTGIETEDGFKARTPAHWSFDIHADYGFTLGGGRLVLAIDIFNLLNARDPIDYDQNTEIRPQVDNPDFGRRILYQNPRSVRLGLRFDF
jgi:hypothetical protein